VSIFEADFMRRALLAAVLVGMAAPAIGTFLVQRQLALIGEGIGHVALTGVALGFVLRTAPVVTALVVAVAGGVVMELLRERRTASGDVALALLLYGGLAGGVLLTNISDTPTIKLQAYLFGSVSTVSSGDVAVVAALTVGVLAVVIGLRRELFSVSYDEEVAHVSGLPVRALNLLIAGTAALTVVLAMRVVGVLLVSALMVVPVASMQQVARSFRATLLGSLVIGVAVSVTGLVIAFYVDVAPGSAIVLTAIAMFIVMATVARLRARRDV
jgi:zinc transport system permease protein